MKWKQIIEALLFSSPRPLSTKELLKYLTYREPTSFSNPFNPPPKTEEEIMKLLEELNYEYRGHGHVFEIVNVNGKWQLMTRPEFAPWIELVIGERPRPARLSQSALETLTIIAYRQPITRAEIEEIRGVSIDGVLHTLIERGLVKVIGKSDLPGRPLLYGTTELFLEVFGLKDLSDLPNAEELRSYKLDLAKLSSPNTINEEDVIDSKNE